MFFTTTLFNVLVMFIYMIPGFLLAKFNKASVEHLSTLSSVLIYGFGPFMIITSLMSLEFSLENLKYMGLFFLATFVLQLLFILLLFLFVKKYFPTEMGKVGAVSSIMGNTGFFGLPLVKAIFPDEPVVLCYSVIFVVSMNIIVFTVGNYALTGDVKSISIKNAILNPSVCGFIVGMIFHLSGFMNVCPDFLYNAMDFMGKITTPLCMAILGIRMSEIPFKRLFGNPKIYLICFTKLVLYPLLSYLAIYFIPLPFTFKGSLLILCAVPCASIMFNLAEMLHTDPELPANALVLSTLLCVVTIPCLSLLL